MEIRSHGYLHYTTYETEGNQARVLGHSSREQTQAAIAPFTEFSLRFYGLGRGIQIGIRAYPVRGSEARMARVRSAAAGAVAGNGTPPALAGEGPAPTGTLARIRVPGRGIGGGTVDPFGHPIAPPVEPPEPPGGGGGGGGVMQAAVQVQLFAPGLEDPVQVWNLPAEVTSQLRQVTFDPPGFPSPDAPARRIGWWRVTVTPQGPGPATIYVEAHTTIGRVPFRTKRIPVRLFNSLFRVAIEAMVPRVVIEGGELQVSMGKELAELLGVSPEIYKKDIPVVSSSARLVSLKITAESGRKLKDVARERGRMSPRLDRVKDDDVALRIQAAFENASASIFGVDLATLEGQFGELFLAFDHSFTELTPAAFVAVDFFPPLEMAYDAYVQIKGVLLDMGNVGPSAKEAVNEFIELYFRYPTDWQILGYLRLVLGRAIGQRAVVDAVSFGAEAWQVRYFDDPVLPPEDAPWRPWRPGMGDAMGGLSGGLDLPAAEPGAPSPTPGEPAPADPAPSSDPLGTFPPEFHVEAGDALERLDRHQTLVVIMMENRSYDHMLGGLAAARPRAEGGYDGPPSSASSASAGGFLDKVPLVATRKIGMGTQIPVSPSHHYFEHGEDHVHTGGVDTGEAHYPVPFQIGDGTDATAGSGAMAGFARDLLRRTDSPQLAMTMYGEADLPVYYKLADEFCVCDRWFCAHPGPTWPNRFATILGSIPELDNFEIDDPRIGFLRQRSIFDVLTDHGIEWRVFESDLSLVRMFDRYRLDDRHVVPIDDPADGLDATLRSLLPLPRVMFVEPNFVDIPPVNTANDDHPIADLAAGQAFIARVCDAIWSSGHFRDCLVLITYDEHGGFYDHVPPPGTAKAPPTPLGPRSKLHPDGPEYLGPRVPTFILSPYVSAAKAEKTLFEHTCILKTILVHNREHLPRSVFATFGDRVNAAAHLGQALDLARARQAPQPFDAKRRRPTGGRGLHDIVAGTDLLATDAGGMPGIAKLPPRSVTVVQRTDVELPVEPRDFHAGLRGVLKPRR
ncbi:phosphoesterase [Anaeromyxobacter sp. K]|uniref:alkaline phosphatase family protein n=1 Tax=Anaeromyxobacter sp. (strain K) TaxID=447217 RepID=UPI00015F9E78|nr:alkaline phosphatase family protein [Anaeromyxobacter sp. K]ACG74540.1 phosphoesterase [Anaeromyxobacter sp. K]